MKFKGTVIWAMVLIILAAFVYLYEIKGGQQRQSAAREANRLLPVTTGEITELTLRRPGETVICRRADDGWQITEPLTAAGDRTAIERILETLAGAETNRVVSDSAADLAPFGLDPPQATVEVRSGTAPAGIVHLGQKNPTGSHIYTRREGQPGVYLTGTALLTQAQTELFQLRDRRILAFEPTEVRGLTLQRAQETIEMIRDADGWMLKKPLQVTANTAFIESMLRRLSSALVSAYVAETPGDLRPYGLDRPELSVTLTLGPEAAQKTLHIGARHDPGRCARDESRDAVFVIPDDLYETLNQQVFDLRDRAVLSFEQSRATELELRRDGMTIICRKDTSGQWVLSVPESTAADRWEVEAILSSLAGLKAEEFIDQDPADLDRYGLAAPRLEVVLRDKAGEQLASLCLGRETEEGVYACGGKGAPVVLVNRTIVTSLSPDPETLKKGKTATP